MSGIVALSVNPIVYEPTENLDKKFANDLFWKVSYHQHLGQEGGGLATLSKNIKDPILLKTHPGLFRDKFQEDLDGLRAPLGIGHISSDSPEPYKIIESVFPIFAICFAGNIINKTEIVADLVAQGHLLDRKDDVVLMSQLITQTGWDNSKSMNDNFVVGITHMTEKIEGAYALAILTTEKIYTARGLDAHESLTLAKKQGAVAVVSESNSLYNQGFQIIRELKPGEVITLKNDTFNKIGIIKIKKKIIAQPCSFKWVYTSDPATIINGLTAKEIRRRLGAKHAQRDIENGFIPHYIISVPDSGRYHAEGYKHEFDRQNNLCKISRVPYHSEDLEKYSYSGRSYTPANQDRRDLEAQKKIIPIEKDIKVELVEHDKNQVKVLIDDVLFEVIIEDGKCVIEIDVVLLDDSIVRGTQTVNNLIPKLRAAFEKAISKIINELKINAQVIVKLNIHLRIGNPKLVNTCDWGKSNKKKENLVAFDEVASRIRTTKEIAIRLGVGTCYYNTINDVSEIIEIPLENLCVDCDIIREN